MAAQRRQQKPQKRDVGDSFEDIADGADELIRDEDMQQESSNNATAPPAWWENAWAHIDRKMDSNAEDITSHMNRVCTVQSQRMVTIEQRLEAEARKTEDALKAVETKTNDQQQNKMNDKSAIEMNLQAIEQRTKDLEVGKSTDNKVRDKENAGTYNDSCFQMDAETSFSEAGTTTRRGPP